MLNLLSTDCKAFNRREFLRLGSLAAGGVSLAELLRQRARVQDARDDTAVIQVFLCGGLRQKTNDSLGSAKVLDNLASLAAAQGNAAKAKQFQLEAERLRKGN